MVADRTSHKSLADFMVAALSPALIVTLIGSFVFFLLTVLYQGHYEWRLKWCFGFFILGAVGIGRISIEDGRERAAIFALPLAGATVLAVTTLVDLPLLLNLAIVAIIWYSADKLVSDCTLIDDEQDASGQGLLAHIKLDQAPAQAPEAPTKPSARPEAQRTPTPIPLALQNWWRRWRRPRRGKHAPGLWVIYLSLVALPAFGLLNGLVARADSGRQVTVFKHLLVYVASALGLLMTTSFLGLRRYLRQRQVEMPAPVAGAWLSVGGVLVIALLTFCALLPRPLSGANLLNIKWRLGSNYDRGPSRGGWGKDGVDKPGQEGDTAEGGRNSKDGSARTGPSSSEGDRGQSGQKDSARPGTGASSGNQAGPSTSMLQDVAQFVTLALRWLLLAAVVALGLWWAWKNWATVVAAWRTFVRELRELWARLLGRQSLDSPARSGGTNSAGAAHVPFALFRNPFESGLDRQLPPDELVRYSFEAVEAWARDRGCPRADHQTPKEFARTLGSSEQAVAEHLQRLAELYSRVAYRGPSPTQDDTRGLQALWGQLAS